MMTLNNNLLRDAAGKREVIRKAVLRAVCAVPALHLVVVSALADDALKSLKLFTAFNIENSFTDPLRKEGFV